MLAMAKVGGATMDSQQVGEENSPISRVQISKNDVPKEAFPGGNNINIVWSFFFFTYVYSTYVELYPNIVIILS